MKDESDNIIKLKIAIVLKSLLEQNKSENKTTRSYNDIALSTNMRKATVSNSFNAHSSPNTVTLIRIIEAMGYNLIDFAKAYNSISDRDLKDF
ncbi:MULTISPECIES: hypothetical protein [Mesonia]|uniref:Uncharacterized protein n=1 Tax=Mesonia oceanica TaxID=2687242 RepID=A0AC61Y7Q2_9FLAO|nr:MULTISPECIES: hypothetical protein [Mesonia]MAN28472.1 hypothetical protein [Mesonia sp.]MAQ41391.1 hypothetical protein [Mesonia sp.]MBJ98518.1 hypothetical protein [Flavobacteriaceae bacterium]VVV00507.1 hypothetical protein FVB9532_01778 [Mesonia oceanica]|tara:strand:- start:4650 stop:4928 length:279 start_codon:yes stop_codon:yes gene_type:complete